MSNTKVTITHSDATVHTFTIPPDMEASLNLLREVRIVRGPSQQSAPELPGPVISEEKNIGELLQGVIFELFERLLQQPQFQPPTLKAKIEESNAALALEVEKLRTDAKKAMTSAAAETPRTKATKANL